MDFGLDVNCKAIYCSLKHKNLDSLWPLQYMEGPVLDVIISRHLNLSNQKLVMHVYRLIRGYNQILHPSKNFSVQRFFYSTETAQN